MSDYGMILANDSGNIQIDSTYLNYTYFDIAQGNANSEYFDVYISDGVNNLLDFEIEKIMVPYQVITAGYLGNPLLPRATSDFPPPTYHYRRAGFEHDYPGSGYTYFNLKIFRQGLTNAVPSGGVYGTIIKNSSGEVVFHSEDVYMKIYVYMATLSASPGNYTDITVNDADNNYFFFKPDACFYYSDGTCNMVGIKKINSTTVRLGVWSIASMTPDGAEYDGWPTDNFVLIEVL